MKILKLLNKKNLSIIIFSLLITSSSFAEDKQVDIWNIEKKEVDTISEASCERLYLLMFSKRLFSLEPSEFDHISILNPYSAGSYKPAILIVFDVSCWSDFIVSSFLSDCIL